MAIRMWVMGLLLLGLTSPAWAGDLCISLTASDVIVGKSFRVPTRNTCQPFAGFMAEGGAYAATVTGHACVGRDGTSMGLSLVATHPGIHVRAVLTPGVRR